MQDSIVRRAFTSSSTVRNFVAAVGGEVGRVAVPPETRIAVIGPVTAQTCRELLREPDVLAEAASVQGLVAALTARMGREAKTG